MMIQQKFFFKKFRQIEGRSVLSSLNVKKKFHDFFRIHEKMRLTMEEPPLNRTHN